MKKDRKQKIPDKGKKRLKRYLQQHRLARSVAIGWMAVLLFFYHLLIGRNRKQKERIAIFATVCMFVMAVSFQYIYADSNLSREVHQYMNSGTFDASGDALLNESDNVDEDRTDEKQPDESQPDEDQTDANQTDGENQADANQTDEENQSEVPSQEVTEDGTEPVSDVVPEGALGEDGLEVDVPDESSSISAIEETVSSKETDVAFAGEQQPEEAAEDVAITDEPSEEVVEDVAIADEPEAAAVADVTTATESGDAAAAGVIDDTTASGDAQELEEEMQEDVLDVVLPTTCRVLMTTDDGADVPVVRSTIENRSDFDVAVNVENMRFSVADRGLGVDRNVNMVFEAVNNEEEAKQVRMSGTDRVESDVMSILLKTSATQGDSGTEGAYDLVSDTDAYFRIYGTISTQMSKYWCEDDVQISVVFRFSKAE
jgi:hypothetical protein